MDSLSDVQKKRILKLLERISKDVTVLHKKNAKTNANKALLKEHADLVGHYRRFVSPRKLTGKLIDKAKNKFYYETEYFMGEIVTRQEKFNSEVIEYLERLENEIKKLKKK